jgi:surface antigen
MSKMMIPLRIIPGGTAVLVAAIVALSVAPAAAQINPFRNYSGPVLSKADIAAGREAAARLLAEADPKVGTSESWSGPTSGNTGTLTIERIYQQRGNDCRAVRSSVAYKSGTHRSFLLHACNVSGRWRLAS